MEGEMDGWDENKREREGCCGLTNPLEVETKKWGK